MRAAWYSFCVALLLIAVLRFICQRCGVAVRGLRRTPTLACSAALLTVVPVAGLTVAEWVDTANVHFSIPLVALLLDRAWTDTTGRGLLDGRARSAAWCFGIAAGLALYPMALGGGVHDPYASGWSFGPLFVGLLAFTLGLLIRKNRFGVVMVGTILAYDLHLLESPNVWDYVVDPLFAAAALVTAVRRTRRWLRRGTGWSTTDRASHMTSPTIAARASIAPGR